MGNICLKKKKSDQIQARVDTLEKLNENIGKEDDKYKSEEVINNQQEQFHNATNQLFETNKIWQSPPL